MIKVKFRNLEKSELTSQRVVERVSHALLKFPKASARTVVVTLGMENSPTQPGEDLFKVRTEVIGGRYHGLILEKAAPNLYSALASVCDGLLERLNRFSDRIRVKSRNKGRRLASRGRIAARHTLR